MNQSIRSCNPLHDTLENERKNGKILPLNVYEPDDAMMSVDYVRYGEYGRMIEKLVDLARDEKLSWFEENRKSRKIARILTAFSVVLIILFIMYNHGVASNEKSKIQNYLMKVIPTVGNLHHKIKNVENSPEYMNFAKSVDKKKEATNENYLNILRHMLNNFPKCEETKNLLLKIDGWRNQPDTITMEEREGISKAVFFSCSEMKRSSENIDCDQILSWDDYDFMKRYNIYLTDDIIPEIRKGLEFFEEVSEKLWRHHELDHYIYTLDNLRHYSYAYTAYSLFIRSELPVFTITCELFFFMNIVGTTAQSINLEYKYSLYYELTVTNGATYILSLFIGYGIVYVPIIIILAILYSIYTPFNALHIIYNRFVVSLYKASRLSGSGIDSNNPRLTNKFTSRAMSIMICIRQYLIYMRLCIIAVTACFVVSNTLALLIALQFGTYYYEADSVFSVWSYEIIRMYDNIYTHLEVSARPLLAISMYTIYWFMNHFAVLLLFKVYGRVHSFFAHSPDVSDHRDSSLFVGIRFLLITAVNVAAWYYGYGQIVEILWNNLLKSLLPASHIIPLLK